MSKPRKKILKFFSLLIVPIVIFVVLISTKLDQVDYLSIPLVIFWVLAYIYLALWTIRGVWRLIFHPPGEDSVRFKESSAPIRAKWLKDKIKYSSSEKKEAKYKKELDSLAENYDIDPPKTPEQILKSLKNDQTKALKEAQDSDSRDLNLWRLITITLQGFGEALDTIKSEYDPLVRLAIVYMYVEQLSDEYSSNESSSLGKFSYKFFKQELSDEDWEINFEGTGPDEGDFEVPSPWGNIIQDKIQSSYKELPEHETRSNICVMFCTDLVSLIDDDDLIQRFISLARDTLTESGFMTKSAEGTFSSMEL